MLPYGIGDERQDYERQQRETKPDGHQAPAHPGPLDVVASPQSMSPLERTMRIRLPVFHEAVEIAFASTIQ